MEIKNWYLPLSTFKKVLLGLFSLVAMLVLTALTIELFTSYTVSKSINENAPVKIIHTITIKAPVKNVFSILGNVNNWSAWQKDISSSTLNGAFQAGSSFDWKTGGLSIHSTLHTVEPFRNIGWSGRAFGAFAIHNWFFMEENGYTIVTVHESMEGWLVKLIKGKFQQGLERSTQSWLNALKQKAEKM